MNNKNKVLSFTDYLAKKFVMKPADRYSEDTQYLTPHNQEGVVCGTAALKVTAAGAAGMAGICWDEGALSIFDNKQIGELKKEIEVQAVEYRRLVVERMKCGQLLDSLFLVGQPLSDLLESGDICEEMLAAYAAARPDLAVHTSLVEAVRSCEGAELISLIAGVKGKLFEMEYSHWLNDGNLPKGYLARIDDLLPSGRSEERRVGK